MIVTKYRRWYYPNKAGLASVIYNETVPGYDQYCHYGGTPRRARWRRPSPDFCCVRNGSQVTWLGSWTFRCSCGRPILFVATGKTLTSTSISGPDKLEQVWVRGDEGDVSTREDAVGTGRIDSRRVETRDRHPRIHWLSQNQNVFKSCTIPAIVAAATLQLCFMNPEMFQRNIKIGKAAVEVCICCCYVPNFGQFITWYLSSSCAQQTRVRLLWPFVNMPVRSPRSVHAINLQTASAKPHHN
jgi:hypothetical protein